MSSYDSQDTHAEGVNGARVDVEFCLLDITDVAAGTLELQRGDSSAQGYVCVFEGPAIDVAGRKRVRFRLMLPIEAMPTLATAMLAASAEMAVFEFEESDGHEDQRPTDG